jgi:2-polyprenyl-3-methyl-5-hydroxy-6-metoxy-1,4-benzoquinol methylase
MDYLALNKAMWNDRAAVHLNTAFYDVPGFLSGNNCLKEPELSLLGDISGKTLLHLQCHFGLDSLSLARMGAEVTGLDFSEQAITAAEALASQAGLKARFICANIYDLPLHDSQQYDLVFSSYGTIGWLPDLDAWAKVLSDALKPGGRFVFAEFHPVVWMFDDDFKEIKYAYFQREAIVEELSGTYADPKAALSHTSVSWNHSLDQVIMALLGCGLQLRAFHEYDYSPYDCFFGTREVSPGKFQLIGLEGKLPMVYALEVVKPAC